MDELGWEKCLSPNGGIIMIQAIPSIFLVIMIACINLLAIFVMELINSFKDDD